MQAKILFVIALFFTSLLHAHPNHMSFEDIHHINSQVESIPAISDTSSMPGREVKHGHNDTAPCAEQHKKVPCKGK